MGVVKPVLYDLLEAIPVGRVTWYGHMAQAVRMISDAQPTAQVIGWILSGMSDADQAIYPWHRVIAKTGYISTQKLGERGMRHIQMLEDEGIVVVDGYVDMTVYGYTFESIG